MQIDLNHKIILISRTDSIGDVVLTLPMCGVLKQEYPFCKIIFLGRDYTLPLIKRSLYVDEALSFDPLETVSNFELIDFFKQKNCAVFIHVFPSKKIAKAVKMARIPIRIGTARRLFHLFTCNKKINLRRKNSNKHETQLNLELLTPLGINANLKLKEIPNYYGLDCKRKTTADFSFLDLAKIKIILHPKSKGSAKEWGADSFSKFIRLVDLTKYQLVFSGTKQEGDFIRQDLIDKFPQVIDLTGKYTLDEFIDLIICCDGIIAASTGPLHIAAAYNKKAIGLYTNIRPMFPTRWAPIGVNSVFLIEPSGVLSSELQISAEAVLDALEKN